MRFPMTAWLLVLLAFGAHAAEPDRRIAITIDDLPWQRMDKTPAADLPLRHAQLMAQLKQAGVPVVGFVNEGKLEADGQVQSARVAMLRDWLGAGYELGNHTHGHVDLHAVGLPAYRQDILDGERVLRPLLAERGLAMEAYPVLPPYARHVRVTGLFADLACARVERVAGLELRDYLPRAQAGTAQAAWQNLLAEVQMQLYQHPVNHAREARRQASLNSIWLDGVGALPAGFAPAQVDIIPDLQQAAERGDLAAWRNAWLHMEGERVPQWQAALDSGAALELHLCGLGQSAVFIPAERGLAAHVKRAWQRWRSAEPGVYWPSALAAPS